MKTSHDHDRFSRLTEGMPEPHAKAMKANLTRRGFFGGLSGIAGLAAIGSNHAYATAHANPSAVWSV